MLKKKEKLRKRRRNLRIVKKKAEDLNQMFKNRQDNQTGFQKNYYNSGSMHRIINKNQS
jgi:hypothetical protein